MPYVRIWGSSEQLCSVQRPVPAGALHTVLECSQSLAGQQSVAHHEAVRWTRAKQRHHAPGPSAPREINKPSAASSQHPQLSLSICAYLGGAGRRGLLVSWGHSASPQCLQGCPQRVQAHPQQGAAAAVWALPPWASFHGPPCASALTATLKSFGQPRMLQPCQLLVQDPSVD